MKGKEQELTKAKGKISSFETEIIRLKKIKLRLIKKNAKLENINFELLVSSKKEKVKIKHKEIVDEISEHNSKPATQNNETVQPEKTAGQKNENVNQKDATGKENDAIVKHIDAVV